MASKTTDETLRKGAVVYVAAAGTAIGGVWALLGFSNEPVKVSAKKEKYELLVDDYAGAIERDTEITEMRIAGSTVQVGAEQMCVALGLTQNVNTVTLGGTSPNAMRKFAVKITGMSLRSGTAVTIYCPNATSDADFAIDFSRKEFSKLPFEFASLDGSAGIGQILHGSGNVTKTLSSGSFARDAAVNHYLVAGEGAAADAMTGMSGTLADNEEFVLQISSTAQPITLTHSATFVLDGAVNWVMTKNEDWIKMVYTTSGTKFTEVARYNA